MTFGTSQNSKDIEIQWNKAKSRKTKGILLLIALLCLICLVHIAWSSYLTLRLQNVQEKLDNNNNHLNNLTENVSEFLNYSQETAESDSNANKEFVKNSMENELESTKNNVLHTLAKRSVGSHKQKPRHGRRLRNNRRRRQLRQNAVTAIHIEANPPSWTARTKGIPVTSPLRNWRVADLNNNQTFGISNLISGGFVTAPRAGLYYLYSQVVFTQIPVGYNYVAATIGVKEEGAEPFTKCLITRQPNSKITTTCHASGIKYLRKGDGISILISPKEVYVRLDPKLTYFGAYLLGSV